MFILKMYLIFGVIIISIMFVTMQVVQIIMKKFGPETYTKKGWKLLNYKSNVKDFMIFIIFMIILCLIWPIFLIICIAVLAVCIIGWLCFNKENYVELNKYIKQSKRELFKSFKI